MTDLEKAQWILENGPVNIVWIYESANDIVYRRPSLGLGNVPPWMPLEREIHVKLSSKTQT